MNNVKPNSRDGKILNTVADKVTQTKPEKIKNLIENYGPLISCSFQLKKLFVEKDHHGHESWWCQILNYSNQNKIPAKLN